MPNSEGAETLFQHRVLQSSLRVCCLLSQGKDLCVLCRCSLAIPLRELMSSNPAGILPC